MTSFLFPFFSFIKYILRRKDEHALHSPFLFDFYVNTVLKKQNFIVPGIELQRLSLSKNPDKIEPLRLGAVSKRSKDQKTVKQIAKTSLSPMLQNAFLASVIHYLKLKNGLELGTSFGINAAYMAFGDQVHLVVTIEGNTEIAKLAKINFEQLKMRNVYQLIGDFKDMLPVAISKLPSLDIVFFDGNHRYQATMDYFVTCLPFVHSQSVFVFHDIYSSKEMKTAWDEIVLQQKVTISLDFYYFGLVFRQGLPKQHFVLKY